MQIFLKQKERLQVYLYDQMNSEPGNPTKARNTKQNERQNVKQNKICAQILFEQGKTKYARRKKKGIGSKM